MKLIFRALLGTALGFSLMTSPPALANDNTSACGVVLCLAGIIDGGNAGGACSDYLRDYFSIVRFHHGHFDSTGTLNARGDFLNQCQSVGADQRNGVNSRYGGQQLGP